MTAFVRYSEVRAFMWCRRNWHNKYVLNLTPKGGDGDRAPATRDVGTLVHRDLEMFHRGHTAAPGEFLRAETPPPSEGFAKEWASAYDLARKMTDGYAEWLESEGHEMGETTLAVEHELWLPFPELDTVVVCHTDRLVQDSWGEVCVEDTKSVDTLVKDDTFVLDWQLLTYILAARECGFPATYARHNMLRRVKRTGTAKPPFYGRVEIRPNTEQLVSHRRNLAAVLADMSEVRYNEARCYPNPGKDCSWRCEFKAICAMHDDGSDLAGVRAELYEPRTEMNG